MANSPSYVRAGARVRHELRAKKRRSLQLAWKRPYQPSNFMNVHVHINVNVFRDFHSCPRVTLLLLNLPSPQSNALAACKEEPITEGWIVSFGKLLLWQMIDLTVFPLHKSTLSMPFSSMRVPQYPTDIVESTSNRLVIGCVIARPRRVHATYWKPFWGTLSFSAHALQWMRALDVSGSVAEVGGWVLSMSWGDPAVVPASGISPDVMDFQDHSFLNVSHK